MPANNYYDSTGAPSTGSTASSSSMRAEFDAIETGFTAAEAALALKATLASPTFTGTVTIPTPFTLGAVSVLPTGTELNFVDGVTSNIQTQIDAKSPTASPTFTGTVTVPTPFTLGATSVTATGTELNYVAGVTSAIQTQFTAKAPLASPTFTGTVTIPTPFTLGAVSVLPTGTELNFVDGVTSNIQTQLDAKSPTASPTFTGTVTIPTPFTLGAVSVLPTGTELNFVDGVTSNIQTQLDAKSPLASPTFTGTVTLPTLVGSDATDATSKTAAACKTAGGLAAAKIIWAGTGFTVGETGAAVTTSVATDGSLKFAFPLETFRVGAPVSATNLRHTMFGVDALASITGSGVDDNTAFGYNALKLVSSGEMNTAVGSYALAAAQATHRNTAVGYKSLFAIDSGYYQTALGTQAGLNATSGTNNTFIGYNAGTDAVASITTESNYIVLGNNSIANANIKVAWTVTSDMRDKTAFAEVPHGLDFVNSLKPTAYQYSVSRDDKSPVKDGKVRYGFLAQDILAVEGDNPVVIDNRDPDNLKFNESSLIAVLVKAIQELSKRLDERP
jgi:hypothetical protein